MNTEHAYISHSPAETEALGERWGAEAKSGWVIGLSGDLGAGKTQLVKGLARGLGARDKVQSPTFPLIHEYAGGHAHLFHLDLYRLDTREQIIAAGLEEYFYNPPGVAVIEWIERWIGDDHTGATIEKTGTRMSFRLVKIETVNENERRITYEDFGR